MPGRINSHEREAVKGIYKNRTWARRINDLPDSEVFAYYKRFKDQGKVK